MSKKKNNEPLSRANLRSFLGTWYSIPYEALLEIINWDYINKSPCSLSFYNKKKDWHTTEKGTIRISDHWNFIAYKRGRNGVKEDAGKTHAITDIDIPQGTWAKGEYNHITDTFKITKIYGTIGMNEEEYLKLRKLIIETIPAATKIEFPKEIIEKRRSFSEKIKNGNVFIKINNELKLVTRLTRSRIDYLNGVTIIIKSVDVEGQPSIPIQNHSFIVNGDEVTRNFLIEENMI